MSGPSIFLVSVLAPGLFCWWSGRQLLRRRDDAALAERLLVRRQHVQAVTVLSCVALAFAARDYYWFAVVGLVVGSWIGDYPSRRVVLDEAWTLGTYLLWHARFTTAYAGLWLALLLAPTVIHAAGPWRWPVAAALAATLGLWAHRYASTFFWLVDARPLAPPAEWQAVVERSRALPPRLFSLPVPGGRFVNAFAFPSPRLPSVIFTASALELLSPREQAAIFAHEVAHLEHYDGRRCRLASAASYALVALGTLGAALALRWLPGGSVVLGWSLALLVGFALRASRQKTHETESDLRALALCGDADALISGLTQLTLAGRIPRRWSSEIEQHASHPSLARRLHAIRRAAGIVVEPPPGGDALLVSSTRSGAHVILDDHGVSWLDGVREAGLRDPALVRRAAASSWSVPYTELVELRVAASWWGGTSLVARDRTGRSRRVAIAAADVRALQQRLDAIEGRLSHDALVAGPPAVVGRLASLALWLASIGALLPLGILVGLIGVIRPSRAALAAVAGTAGACVLVAFGELADGSHHWTTVASAASAALVAAMAAWIAVKPRPFDGRKADWLPVVLSTAVVLAMTWGPLGVELVRGRSAATTVMELVAGTPILWATLGVLGCALIPAPRRTLTSFGVGLLAVAVLANLGGRIVDVLALSGVVAPPTGEHPALSHVARLAVPPHAASLRVSPLGTRVAVASRHSPRDARGRFVILGVDGGRAEVEARDLQFIDESNALVITESADEAAVQHVEASGGPDLVRGSRTVVAGVTGLRLSAVDDSTWAGLGYDAETEELVGLGGRLGVTEVTRRPLPGDDVEDARGNVLALSPDGRGLRAVSDLTPLARLPWARLLYTGRLPRESRVWRLTQGGQELLATLPGHVDCHLVGRGLASVVCIGTERGRTLVWRFDLAKRPTAPLVIPGVARRSGVSRDGRLVALWTPGEILMVDLDLARAHRWEMARAVGFPIQVVPAGERVILFGWSEGTAAIDVYDARR